MTLNFRRLVREEIERKMALPPDIRVQEDFKEAVEPLPLELRVLVSNLIHVRACAYCGEAIYYGPWRRNSFNQKYHEHCVKRARRQRRRENIS